MQQESVNKMPEVPLPSGDGWESWIIGTFVAMFGTMVTTIVAMVRFIQGQYQQTIKDLEARISLNEKHVETLTSETIKCFEDRAILRGRVDALEKRSEH